MFRKFVIFLTLIFLLIFFLLIMIHDVLIKYDPTLIRFLQEQNTSSCTAHNFVHV